MMPDLVIQTEDDLVALGTEEHYDIERKAGKAIEDLSKFRTLVADAVCALANSGGGYLILGQENNRLAFDGLPESYKGRPTHEWLNQLVPQLVVPTLSSVRVRSIVKKQENSAIPDGQSVYVVEVPDSAFAPHQTKEGRQYLYREGSNSVRAPHFYLEALRSRLIAPILKISDCEFRLGSLGSEPAGRALFTFSVRARLRNEGRIACYRWAIKYELIGAPDSLWTPHDGWVGPTDEVILHSGSKSFGMDFGLLAPANRGEILHYPDKLASLTLSCCAISDRGPGEPIEWAIGPAIDNTLRNEIASRSVQWLDQRKK